MLPIILTNFMLFCQRKQYVFISRWFVLTDSIYAVCIEFDAFRFAEASLLPSGLHTLTCLHITTASFQ